MDSSSESTRISNLFIVLYCRFTPNNVALYQKRESVSFNLHSCSQIKTPSRNNSGDIDSVLRSNAGHDYFRSLSRMTIRTWKTLPLICKARNSRETLQEFLSGYLLGFHQRYFLKYSAVLLPVFLPGFHSAQSKFLKDFSWASSGDFSWHSSRNAS